MTDSLTFQTIGGWLASTIAQNLVVTAAMIPLVWLLCRGFRDRPAVQHLLWLLVLVKFVTPPLPGWTWQIPDLAVLVASKEHVEPIPTELTMICPEPIIVTEPPHMESFDTEYLTTNVVVAEIAKVPSCPPPAAPLNKSQLAGHGLLVIWLVGGIAYLFVQARRMAKCYRVVRSGVDAQGRLAQLVQRVAETMGLRRLPTRIVSGITSPFLWCLGPARLAWPETLANSSEPAIRAIVVHEVAHLRRRDHWVGWLELLAATLWWWNPLFWFVRRQIHCTAEMSCDAIALDAYPEDRCSYAETLLWLSVNLKIGAPPQVLAIGGGTPSSIERRMTMIASQRASGKLSVRGFLLTGLLGLIALPGWSLAQTELTAESNEGPAIEGRSSDATTIEGRSGDVHVDKFEYSSSYDPQSKLTVGKKPIRLDSGDANNTTTIKIASADRDEHLLRMKAMHLIALADKRTSDAEALQAGIDALEAQTAKVKRKAPAESLKTSIREVWNAGAGQVNSVLIDYSSSNPRSLRGHENLAVRTSVTGSADGTIWGTDVYSDDSPIDTAAVHAGLVKLGATADVVVLIRPGQQSYAASQRNGVSSLEFGSYSGSYQLIALANLPDAPYFCARLVSSNDIQYTSVEALARANGVPLEPGVSLIVPIVGSTSGPVWGSGTYTADSNLDSAAVHAGILAAGETGLVKLTLVKGLDKYEGTSQNGVDSRPYGAWTLSYRLEALPNTHATSGAVNTLELKSRDR